MPTIWDTLGLDGPPDTMKTLKRAYSARLKVTRPEDDAEGFMALRQAFEAAQYHLRAQDTNVVASTIAAPDVIGAKPEDPIFIVAGEDAPRKSSGDEPAQSPIYLSPANLAIQDLHEMISHPFKRNDIASWEDIFGREDLEAVDDWVEFDHRLRDYLLQIFGAYDDKKEDHNRNRKPRLLNTKTGTFIFDKMDWHDTDSRNPGIAQELAWLREDLDVIAPRGTGINSTYNPQHSAISKKEPLEPGVAWFLFIAGFMILRVILSELDLI